MRNLRDETGQAMIITILAMTCLAGFAALATDIGLMLREKRMLQTAADAAAIAGAAEFGYADVNAAATAAATTNGYTAGTTTTVTVNNPPTSGYHTSTSDVEVIITHQVSTIFMRLFGRNAMTVAARAVAENGGTSDGCGYFLGKPGDPNSGLQLQGSFNVDAPSCGILVNGVLSFTGNGGSMTAGYVGYAAGESTSGNQLPPSTPTPVQMAPINDPLANKVTFPDTSQLSCNPPPGTSGTVKGVTTVIMSGTITPAGSVVCYSGNVSLAGVTLGGGATYVFTGNVTLDNPVNGSPYAVQTGDGGATIDMANGSLTDNTNGSYSLTSEPYSEIVLEQPPSNTSTIQLQTGNSLGTLDGIIYAPTAELYLQDSGGDAGGGTLLKTDLIVGGLDDKTASLNIEGFSQSNGGSSLLTKVALVE